jgi:hypothetical protein
MATDESRQHFSYGGPILGRIASDTFERINASQPHVPILVAKLIDCSSEPLRDLALATQLVQLAA